MKVESNFRKDIQALRGLAVLAVVLFHANENNFPLGYLGVDVFFVISGFVVTPLILRIITDQSDRGRLSNLGYFYKRRFYRLAPALVVMLAISALIIFLLGPIGDHQKFARQGIATLILVGNVGAYRYSGDYFSPNPNPLVHTWSLSVEEQIYIFLPLILILILRNRKKLKRMTFLVFGSISALSFVSFLFGIFFQPLYSRAGIEFASIFSFYSSIDRIWQFTLGGLVYLFLDRYQNRAWNSQIAIRLITVFAIVIVLFGPIEMGLKASSILASLFAGIVIIFKSLDVLPNFLTRRLVWVGDRSYSIYLVHMPLMYLAKYSPMTQIGNFENRIIQSTIAVIFSISLGALSYSKIENKYRSIGKNNSIGLKNSLATMVLVLVVPLALFVVMDRGVKQQYWGLERNIQKPPYAGFLDPNCERDSENGPPCVYKTTGATKTLLLIGDSHAGHISQAVVDAAQITNWNAVIWTHSGCLIQFERNFAEQLSDDCIDINNSMKKWVDKNRPHAIIVSQFVRSDSSQEELTNALSTLQSMVPNILLIGNNPVFPDLKDFMVQRPFLMSQYEAPKNFKQSLMDFKDMKASNQLTNWARDNNIDTMDFTSLFCNREICTRWSDGAWLYRDANHFSVSGARLTIPHLISFLKKL